MLFVLTTAFIWSFYDQSRVYYHIILAALPSLSVMFLKKARQSSIETMLKILPFGMLFSLLLPGGLPWGIAVVFALLLGQLKYWRPRLPVLPMILGLLILSWPALFVGQMSPIANAFRDADGTTIRDTVQASGVRASPEDKILTDQINNLLAQVGVNIPVGYPDIFFGRMGSTLADFSWPLLLFGFLFLLGRGYLSWQAPAGFLLLFLPGVILLGGFSMGKGLGEGDALFFLLSGSFMLPLLFGLSDYSLLPLGGYPRFLFGLSGGLLASLGSAVYPLGTPYATLIIIWLLQRVYERTLVSEVYHQGDSMLLLWNGV